MSVAPLDPPADDDPPHSHRQPRIYAGWQAKRRCRTVGPPTRRGFITRLVYSVGPEFVPSSPETFVVDVRDQQRALAIGRKSMPGARPDGSHLDFAARKTGVPVDRVDDHS